MRLIAHVSIACDSCGGAFDNEDATIWKKDQLRHDAALGHRLDLPACSDTCRVQYESRALCAGRNLRGERGRVHAIRDCGSATDHDLRREVIVRSERKKGGASGEWRAYIDRV